MEPLTTALSILEKSKSLITITWQLLLRWSGLKILRAEWGTGPENCDYADVTVTVAGYVQNNAIAIRAQERYLGDPYFGKEKHLRVLYSYRGKKNQHTVAHNDWLRLP